VKPIRKQTIRRLKQSVDFGREFVNKVLNLQNTIREFLNITEGYDKARVEMNLSFLTKEN